MSTGEKAVWKTAAKESMKTSEFRALQSAHRRVLTENGRGLGLPIPSQTFFTRNENAALFMKNIADSV